MTDLEQTNSDFEYTEIKETFSTWKNNSKNIARFKLVTDEKKPGKLNGRVGPNGEKATQREAADCKVSTFYPVEIKPGATIQLPTKYDQAIRWISPKTGEAVQGLCPWLVKVGEEDVVVHTSLDYTKSIQTQDALDLVAVMKRKQELLDALALLEKVEVSAKKTDKK